jgi:hypothetical protein
MQILLDDVEHWWSRAEETRTIAELLSDPRQGESCLTLPTATTVSPSAPPSG